MGNVRKLPRASRKQRSVKKSIRRCLNVTYVDDGVETIIFSILHVGGEHQLDFVEIVLSSSAESGEERVVEPGILVALGDVPFFELVENLSLRVAHGVQIARRNEELEIAVVLTPLAP